MDDQTPKSCWKTIIDSLSWQPGEIVLEPFRGDGNCFHQLPSYVVKNWQEIEEGFDFFEYNGSCDTIITNPPFKDKAKGKNLVIPALEKSFSIATRRVIFLVNHQVFNSLTPVRINKYHEWGWSITRLSVYSIKKWFGRYWLIVFENGKTPIIGWDIKNYSE